MLWLHLQTRAGLFRIVAQQRCCLRAMGYRTPAFEPPAEVDPMELFKTKPLRVTRKRRFEESRFMQRWQAYALSMKPPVSRPDVTDLEMEILKKYVKEMQAISKKPTPLRIEDLRSRASLLKSLGLEVTNIVEAAEILFLTEDELVLRWRLVVGYSMMQFPRITGPMLALCRVGARLYTRSSLLQLQYRGNGEMCVSDRIKRVLGISERELQRVLRESSGVAMMDGKKFRVARRLDDLDWIEQKLKIVVSYGVALPGPRVLACAGCLINFRISPEQLKRRLWHVWYNNLDFERFPLELLNSSTDDRFYVLVDLYRLHGQSSVEKLWEMFERRVMSKDYLLSVWSYQFVKMHPLRGKANLMYLIDKGFHFDDILNSSQQTLAMDLKQLAGIMGDMEGLAVDPSALTSLGRGTEDRSRQVRDDLQRLLYVYGTVRIFLHLLGWPRNRLQLGSIKQLGVQPLKVLLRNYTFLRHVGFTESDLQQVPGVLVHPSNLVVRRVELVLRYGCGDSGGCDSITTKTEEKDEMGEEAALIRRAKEDNNTNSVAVLNYVQYCLEKEQNFRDMMILG